MSTDVKVPQQLPATQHAAPDGVKLPIYMDNHATTPMDPRVLEEMLPFLSLIHICAGAGRLRRTHASLSGGTEGQWLDLREHRPHP